LQDLFLPFGIMKVSRVPTKIDETKIKLTSTLIIEN
jgi:hypothetical protein